MEKGEERGYGERPSKDVGWRCLRSRGGGNLAAWKALASH